MAAKGLTDICGRDRMQIYVLSHVYKQNTYTTEQGDRTNRSDKEYSTLVTIKKTAPSAAGKNRSAAFRNSAHTSWACYDRWRRTVAEGLCHSYDLLLCRLQMVTSAHATAWENKLLDSGDSMCSVSYTQALPALSRNMVTLSGPYHRRS